MLRIDDGVEIQDDGSLDDIGQLPRISRPGIGQELLHGPFAEALERLVVLFAGLFEEMAGERKDVLRSLS